MFVKKFLPWILSLERGLCAKNKSFQKCRFSAVSRISAFESFSLFESSSPCHNCLYCMTDWTYQARYTDTAEDTGIFLLYEVLLRSGLRQKFVLWQMALDLGPPRLPKKTEKCVVAWANSIFQALKRVRI